ncbi:MAG: hypothetical protein CSA76_05955 [Spirochaetales bacterium]|nr:MAG: hypothetical protein CSA76_05955 [Spirochaetales bacterium]
MTFNFDGGDILVILLVAAAFILSRRFDKTGRSLEKVRRYADKSKAELDTIIRERELAFKDLSVDLEVQEQTNREILNRADQAREELLSRAGELEDRVEKIEAHERALEELNDLALRVDENLSRLKDESAYVDKVGSRLTEVRSRFDSFAEKDERRFADFRQEVLGIFSAELQNLENGMEEAGRQISLFQENLGNINVRQVQESEKRISEYREELEKAEAEFSGRLEKVAEDGASLEDAAFTALKEKIDSRSKHLEGNWLDGMSALKDSVTRTAEEIRRELAGMQQNMEQVSGEYREIDGRLTEASRTFNAGLDGLRGRLENILDEKETSLLEEYELRQGEYRRNVEERFSRIEGSIADMDTLTESLKSSQQQTLRDVEVEFRRFDEEMTERRDIERTQVEDAAAALRQEMDELEQGLDELKSRAYENVSEKLQVFEDDFFADLKTRDKQMHSSLEEWRDRMDADIEEWGRKAAREREETELRYTAEIREKLTELQNRTFAQFESFQDQVDGFRESISGRISSSEEEVNRFRGEISRRIADDKEELMNEFDKTYDSFQTELGEKFARANKTISQKLTAFSGDIDNRHKALIGDIEAASGEIGDLKERLQLQIDEAVRGSADSIAGMRADFNESITELEDEFKGKTEQLILESGEERAALRREIDLQQEAVANLAAEITEKSRDSLDTLKDMSETFLMEFRKSSKDARGEVERKVKELRQMVQDARERAENSRKEMASHTDTEYKRLMKNLDEIDKRQKKFIAETRVFERADEMKTALEADIHELNRQLDQTGKGREEVRNINESYEKAIRLYSEVNTKMTRFLAEQQKVDNLEGKISRISNLSDAVDLKLERVAEANDTLQTLQMRVKQMEDLHEDLDSRYKRLSEKNTVLDAATEGVDKNFERMNRIEELIRNLAEQVIPLKQQMADALAKQAQLESGKAKVDEIVSRMTQIDAALKDADSRMDDLQKARKWLARIETRLSEIYTEAQENVRVLGTLSKKSGSRKSKGAPDMSMREIVVKLAREGWKSDEIAQHTKLGIGEVELILESTPHA